MERRPIIPDGDIVGVLPPVADLQVVVFHQQVDEPIQQFLALVLREPVDVPNVPTHGEDALPPCDGVRPDDGMLRLELRAHVLRGTPRFVVELEAVGLGDPVESRLLEGCRQRL